MTSAIAQGAMALAAGASLLAARGAAALPPVRLSQVTAGSGGFVLNGIDVQDNSGTSASGAGDVNGDGLADVVIGGWNADAGSGESYVVFGKPDGTAVNLFNVVLGDGGFVINGIDPGDRSGLSVSGAGDVNGDGLSDVIVGAPFADPAGHGEAGESYLVFGKADAAAVDLADVVAGNGGFVINGIDPVDQSGWSVSCAGDVNGDRLSDVIVGGPYADPAGHGEAGESYVVFGKADGKAVELADVVAGNGGFVINGIDAGDFSGAGVSGAGDVNGDGLGDVIVGARGVGQGGDRFAGASYVVFGKADGTPVDLADVVAGNGGFVIDGISPGDMTGFSVSGAGDVNGDRLADVIVGAPGAGISQAGASYVVFGKADGKAVELADVVAGNGGFVINGIDPGDTSGASVSGAGDVDGDGLADVIVGALLADVAGVSAAGECYVVFGKRDGTAVSLSDVVAGNGGFAITGINQGDHAGISVAGAGDVDDDGFADVIVGARGGDPAGHPDAGESYVVFSPAVCLGDCQSAKDTDVGIFDLLALLGQWGLVTPCDIDGGGVGITDLLALLANWGPCP